MKLYEIDEAIEHVFTMAEIDPETGAYINLNESLLEFLEGQREAKIESLIGYYKDLAGDVEKFDNEIKNLQTRQKSIKNKRESIKWFLHYLHKGQRKEYGVHKIGYRKSEILIEGNIRELPEQYYNIETIVKPIKADIKKAIKEGRTFKGWSIEEHQNIQIK